MFFPVAGIFVPLWLPPLVGLFISLLSSMGGVSGAVFLLPFQMSVLGYVTPSVSATNLVFNSVAIPAGVWGYTKEQRMHWSLAWIIVAGSLPGLLAGWWIRLHWLVDPRLFKLFVGVLILWLAMRLLWRRPSPAGHSVTALTPLRKLPVLYTAVATGMIGGTYGIGGGAILAPLMVILFDVPIHAVAGASLFGTLITSLVGVAVYQWLPAPPGIESRPDWMLGALYGAGGAVGTYLGARTQKQVPPRVLHRGMAIALTAIAAGYVVGFFR